MHNHLDEHGRKPRSSARPRVIESTLSSVLASKWASHVTADRDLAVLALFEEEDGAYPINNLPNNHPAGTAGLIVITDEDFDRNTPEWGLVENIALGSTYASIGLMGPDSYGGPLVQRPHIHEALKGAALAFHERMLAWALDSGVIVVTPASQDYVSMGRVLSQVPGNDATRLAYAAMVVFAIANARLTDSKYNSDNHSLDRAKKAPSKVRAQWPFPDNSDNSIHDYVGLTTHT